MRPVNRRQQLAAAAAEKGFTNWPLLIFLFFLPLRNLVLKFFPPLPGGINFVNVFFVLAFFYCLKSREKIDWSYAPNKKLLYFILYLFLSLLIMRLNLTYPIEGAFNALKDFVFILCLSYIVQRSITRVEDAEKIIIALILPLPYVFRLVYSQYQSVARWHYSDDLRVNGPMYDLGSNELGAYLVTTTLLLVSLVFFFKASKKWLRYFIYLALVLSGISLTLTYSRGAYLATILACMYFYLIKENKGKLTLILVLFTISLPVIMPVSVVERFSSISSDEEDRDESAASRFVFWEAAFEKAEESPVWGYGYRSWRSPEINKTGMDTHNYFVKTIVEGGAIGLILLLTLVYANFKLARYVYKNATDPTQKALALAVLLATLGMMVGNMFGDRFSHYSVVFIYWTLVGAMIKLQQLTQQPAPAAAKKRNNKRYQ
ncbi:O-antigen ligase family protein [Thalassomonas viridans]|uniref:O-antigen ligase family protein n=1 Tax=Thalassomonas viridans TaxID=137584 RepID=A0AAF0C927_9GAMM|nr:O-antigen ligase family protein [Thalassomonas viridans]WDE05011.1 O-antigen ligase family protein [Thalassomonas viridans]